MKKKSNTIPYTLTLALLVLGLAAIVWWSTVSRSPTPPTSLSDNTEPHWQFPDLDSLPTNVPVQTSPPSSQPAARADDCTFRAEICDGLAAYRAAVEHWLGTGGWTDERQSKFLVLQNSTDERPCIREQVQGTNESICWNNVHFVPEFLYSDEALRELSDTDPTATVILADRVMRTGDRKKAASLYLRATKLSGKPGPLIRFASSSAAFSSYGGDLEYLNERQPDPLEIQVTTYVYSLVADSLGYPLPNSWEVRGRLVDAEVPDHLIHHAETTLHDQLLAYIKEDTLL